VSLLTFILGLRKIGSVFVDIRMDLTLISWGVNWIDLAQDMDKGRAHVKTAMKFRIP